MPHILLPDHPRQERARLLGQARHCRQLSATTVEEHLIEQLVTLAKSYEAKAALLRATCSTSDYTSP